MTIPETPRYVLDVENNLFKAENDVNKVIPTTRNALQSDRDEAEARNTHSRVHPRRNNNALGGDDGPIGQGSGAYQKGSSTSAAGGYNSLFSLSVSSNSIGYFMSTIKQLQEELEEWRMALPISIRPGEQFRAHALPGPLSTTIALQVHLLYYNLVLSLCRASLQINTGAPREDSAKPTRHAESKKMLVKASCAILELTPYIDVAPYTPVWVLAGVPLSGLFVLFDLVIHNPTHPETSTNLALLEVASGHFSRVEYASGGTLPGSLVSDFAHIAREYVRDVHLRETGQGNRIRWSNTLMNQPSLHAPVMMSSPSGVTTEVQAANTSVAADALFFPISDDPYYMPEGLLMGTDVMDLFGSVMPTSAPPGGANEMPDMWIQGLPNNQM